MPHEQRTSKDSLIRFIGSADVVKQLQNLVPRLGKVDREKKRREGRREARMARNRDYARYTNLPNQEERKRRLRMFYEATAANALSTSVCAICDRELMTPTKDRVEKYPWSDFAGKEKLVFNDIQCSIR